MKVIIEFLSVLDNLVSGAFVPVGEFDIVNNRSPAVTFALCTEFQF
jgi:hypothetical protein